MRLESKVGESLSCFVISPSVALTATAPSSEGASETSCVLYDILFRQAEALPFGRAFMMFIANRQKTMWCSHPAKTIKGTAEISAISDKTGVLIVDDDGDPERIAGKIISIESGQIFDCRRGYL